MEGGPYISENGDVISSALNVTSLPHAGNELKNNFRLDQGQVTQIYAVDSPDNNLSGPGYQTVYDVEITLPNGSRETIPRCRMLQPTFGGGTNNYFEVLQTDPGFDAEDGEVDKALKRGHLVLVGYVSGQKNSGVILGSLPHIHEHAVDVRPTSDEGVITIGEIQGFEFKVDNDGALTLTFNGPRDDDGEIIGEDGPTVVTIDSQGCISITTNAEQTVTIDRLAKKIRVDNGPTYIDMDQDGDKIQVVAKIVEIGTGGLQPQLVGDDWKAMMEKLIDAIIQIVVPTGVGPSGTPVNAPQFQQIKANLKECLSKNHKVEK